jgi:integrase/recombinase XerD
MIGNIIYGGEILLEEFREYLTLQGKSKNTINSYYLHIKGYCQWYLESFGRECSVLYRENILDYTSYLRNIKKDTGRTVNSKISALIKYNEFLIEKEIQQDQVVSKNDNIKVQQTYANQGDDDKGTGVLSSSQRTKRTVPGEQRTKRTVPGEQKKILNP